MVRRGGRAYGRSAESHPQPADSSCCC